MRSAIVNAVGLNIDGNLEFKDMPGFRSGLKRLYYLVESEQVTFRQIARLRSHIDSLKVRDRITLWVIQSR